MKNKVWLALGIVAVLTMPLVVKSQELTAQETVTEEFQQFLKDYDLKIAKLNKESNIAYFDASISGKDEDYKKSADLEIKMKKIWSNKEDFARIKKFAASKSITDPLLKRELTVIYNTYLKNQLDDNKLEELVKRQTEIAQKYNTFRANVNGKKMTDNEIEETLQSSTDSKELEAVWKASKEIGKLVAQEVIQLAKLRNQAANELGFKNFHAMELKLSEQEPEEIEKLFDELDNLTRDVFIKAKGEIDTFLAKRYNISKEALMPWHYQNRFFQEAPKIYAVDLDVYYKDKDVVELVRNYYTNMGFDLDEVFKKSSLYERPGQYQHAYCTDIDRAGDVRVVCNVKPNYEWTSTVLHEFGHAAYFKYIDRELPWSLHDCAHTFTTEAIAIMMERLAANPAWLKDVVGIPKEESEKIADACTNSLRLESLVFSRWSQVMYRFEKSLYENPDQNLNKLWWDLVTKYQMLKPPEGRDAPDWASKIHIATVPAYYHNYLMGDLLASQIYYHIATKVLKVANIYRQSFKDQKEVGLYLIEHVFKPGMKYPWNEMIEKATGEKLTPVYYARQFVK